MNSIILILTQSNVKVFVHWNCISTPSKFVVTLMEPMSLVSPAEVPLWQHPGLRRKKSEGHWGVKDVYTTVLRGRSPWDSRTLHVDKVLFVFWGVVVCPEHQLGRSFHVAVIVLVLTNRTEAGPFRKCVRFFQLGSSFPPEGVWRVRSH